MVDPLAMQTVLSPILWMVYVWKCMMEANFLPFASCLYKIWKILGWGIDNWRVLFPKGSKSNGYHMPGLYIMVISCPILCSLKKLSAFNRHDQNHCDVQIWHVSAIGLNAFWKQALQLSFKHHFNHLAIFAQMWFSYVVWKKIARTSDFEVNIFKKNVKFDTINGFVDFCPFQRYTFTCIRFKYYSVWYLSQSLGYTLRFFLFSENFAF